MMGRDDYAKAYSSMKSRKRKKLGVIYIEDITDKQFWQQIAVHHEIKLYSDAGKTITGKSKLLQICSAHQLIAIDSDFDELCPLHREESILCSEKREYILQTYAHGRENIMFSPQCLYEILEHKFKLYMDNHKNPILDIFDKLSALWFEPYQKFLFLHNKRTTSFTHDDWIKAISFQNQEKKDIALNQDFSAYQERMSALNQKLNQYFDNQEEFINFCKHLRERGFSKECVWAFVRCHDFESQFVQVLLRVLKHNRLHQEKLYIQQNFSGQEEISNQNRKLANYFDDKMDSQTVLENYFYDTYCQNYKHQDLFLQKILADYQSVIQEK